MNGAEIRALRERHGLTQEQVAKVAGLQQPALSAMENGKRGSVAAFERVRAAILATVRPSAVLDEPLLSAVKAEMSRYGAEDIRVFGSVARGLDGPGSDLDLIARFPISFDLFDLMEVEAAVESIVGVPVDIVSDSPRAAYALKGAKAEAVPL
jgi:uncharacterized protein